MRFFDTVGNSTDPGFALGTVEFIFGEMFMQNRSNGEKETNATKVPQEYNSRLPIIALTFGLAPMTLWLLGWAHEVFWMLFFVSGLGLGFQIIGLLLGILSLYKEKSNKGARKLTFSVVAILAPFIWAFTIWLLYRNGTEIFL